MLTARDKLIKVPLAKGCFILLTYSEYKRAIQRGKAAKRALSNEQRNHSEGSLLDVIGEAESEKVM